MVRIFIMYVDAPDFFVLLRAFSIVCAVLCANFFPRQTGTNRRVSLHVIDQQGNDQGSLGETRVSATDRSS